MADEKESTEPAKAKGGLKKTIGLVVIGLGVGLIVGKMFLFKSEPASTNLVVEATTTTELNRLTAKSVTLDSKSVNLADGHYAKVQVTVYMHSGEGHSSGKAEDLKPGLAKINADLIAYVSGKTLEEVSKKEFKDELRDFLLDEAKVDYHGEVGDIQISDFVTQ